jgi:hypothetical protein
MEEDPEDQKQHNNKKKSEEMKVQKKALKGRIDSSDLKKHTQMEPFIN